MPAKLISTSSTGEEKVYELTEKVTSIGRDSSNDISVDGELVSENHAQFVVAPVGIILKDLDSVGGTYVNGDLIKNPVVLRDGDKINLGTCRLVLQGDADSNVASDADGSEETIRKDVHIETRSNDLENIAKLKNSEHIRAQQIEVWQYVSILTSQWSFVLVFTLSAILTAIALTYVVSEKYEARTTIFYRPIEVIRLKSQEATAFGSPVPSTQYSVIGKTIEELLQSQLILGRVVEGLSLGEDEVEDYSDEPWYIYYYKVGKDLAKEYYKIGSSYLRYGRLIENEDKVNAIAVLSKNVKVEIDEAYISYIIARDKNNERAAGIANRLGAELISWLKEKERVPLEFRKLRLKDALEDIQEEIDRNRELLLGLLSDNNVSSIKHELEQGNIRVSGLEASRVEMLTLISNFESNIKSIEDKLDQQNALGAEAIEDQSSASRTKRLSSEDFKRLTSELLTLSIALEGERSKLRRMMGEIRVLNERLSVLSILDIEYQRIEELMNKASRDHLQIKDALQEVIVREYSIDSEIGILHEATVPMEPVAPIKIYHAGLAGFLGVVVSVGLVYLLTFFNIRVLFSSAGVAGRRKSTAVSRTD